ncbi:MAG: hypothetical protein AAB267_06645 [Candidatus Desantisbacteria bacterium]
MGIQEKAIQSCDVVLNLCTRTGFKLYEPSAEIDGFVNPSYLLARAYLAQNNPDQAKSFAQSAFDKANQMHYHWPKTEAIQLLEEIGRNSY